MTCWVCSHAHLDWRVDAVEVKPINCGYDSGHPSSLESFYQVFAQLVLVEGSYVQSLVSIGLQAGMENYNADWTKLETEENIQIDEAFAIGSNKFLPNFGAGLYLSNNKFYFGVSSPQLVEYDLRDSESITTAIWARSARHYYMMAGLAIPVKGKALVFKPSILEHCA